MVGYVTINLKKKLSFGTNLCKQFSLLHVTLTRCHLNRQQTDTRLPNLKYSIVNRLLYWLILYLLLYYSSMIELFVRLKSTIVSGRSANKTKIPTIFRNNEDANKILVRVSSLFISFAVVHGWSHGSRESSSKRMEKEKRKGTATMTIITIKRR